MRHFGHQELAAYDPANSLIVLPDLGEALNKQTGSLLKSPRKAASRGQELRDRLGGQLSSAHSKGKAP